MVWVLHQGRLELCFFLLVCSELQPEIRPVWDLNVKKNRRESKKLVWECAFVDKKSDKTVSQVHPGSPVVAAATQIPWAQIRGWTGPQDAPQPREWLFQRENLQKWSQPQSKSDNSQESVHTVVQSNSNHLKQIWGFAFIYGAYRVELWRHT